MIKGRENVYLDKVLQQGNCTMTALISQLKICSCKIALLKYSSQRKEPNMSQIWQVNTLWQRQG